MQRKVRFIVLTVITLLTAAAIVFGQANSAEQQIRDQIQKLNGPGVPNSSLFTADAVFWSNAYSRPHLLNEPESSILKNLIVTPGRKNVDQTFTPERIVVSGDMAYEYSRFVLKFDDSQGHHNLQGAVLRVWQKAGNDWKIAAMFQRPYGRVVPVQR